MGSIFLNMACSLILGTGAAVLLLLPAWLVERSVIAVAESLDRLRIEISKKLDKLHLSEVE